MPEISPSALRRVMAQLSGTEKHFQFNEELNTRGSFLFASEDPVIIQEMMNYHTTLISQRVVSSFPGRPEFREHFEELFNCHSTSKAPSSMFLVGGTITSPELGLILAGPEALPAIASYFSNLVPIRSLVKIATTTDLKPPRGGGLSGLGR